MNIRLILHTLGSILLIEAAAMLPALGLALGYGDGDAAAVLIGAAVTGVCGLLIRQLSRPKSMTLHAREGFYIVAMAWILLSLFGSLPLMLSGIARHPIDAVFEAVSGFTTTGATIVTDFSHMPHGAAFWRSFTHWIGGMGVLVLTLALFPKLSGRTSHLFRAESPGPSLSKIAPKTGDSAKIQYMLYLSLTVLEVIALLIAGLSPYDAVMHTMSTAGTGGFSNYGESVGAFHNPAAEWIITVFMLMFACNFALYYALYRRNWKAVLQSEELRWFLGISFTAIAVITVLILPTYKSFWTSLRTSAFQVASIISTTGFATADFNVWPVAARAILIILMFIGGCAGSTGGGIKVVRTAILTKLLRREIGHSFEPRKVKVIRFEGKGMDESMLHSIAVYGVIYISTVLAGALLISFDAAHDITEAFTASLTCVSNVGPGLGAIGPIGNFAAYSDYSKIIMCFLMLAGRLEFYPMLALLHPTMYKR